MRTLSVKPVTKDDAYIALNREIIPLIRELRTTVLRLTLGGWDEARVAALEARVTAAEAAVVALAAQDIVFQSDIAAIQGDISIIQGDIAALQSAVAALQSYVTGVDFSNRHTPVGAYLFEEGNHLTDRSGNGYTLTASASPVKFGPSYVRGMNAVRLSSGLLELRSTNTAFNLIGAWSAEAVVNPFTWVNNNYIASWRDLGGSELEANNISWTLGGSGGSAITDAFGGAYWEFGAGTDVIPTGHGYLSPGGSTGGSVGWIHVCQTRSSTGRFRTYVNGRQIHEQTGLTMPTGGSTAQLRIGGQFLLAQYLAVYDQELTPANVEDLSDRRLRLRVSA